MAQTEPLPTPPPATDQCHQILTSPQWIEKPTTDEVASAYQPKSDAEVTVRVRCKVRLRDGALVRCSDAGSGAAGIDQEAISAALRLPSLFRVDTTKLIGLERWDECINVSLGFVFKPR
jgi:hypothetical protein